MCLQEERIMQDYLHGKRLIPAEEVSTGGITNEMARRWVVLQNLQVGAAVCRPATAGAT